MESEVGGRCGQLLGRGKGDGEAIGEACST